MATDGTEEKKDVKTSDSPKGTSPATFTEEQVLERERKARSDALADKGRLEQSLKAANDALERIRKREQEDAERRLNEELEAHKDDPAEIKRIRAEERARKLEEELASERQAKTELNERLTTIETQVKETSKTSIFAAIAQKFNVDTEKLSTLAKLTDGSEKAIESLAEAMPKKSTSFRPDQNRGVGGMLTWEEVRDAYVKDPYNPANKERYLSMRSEHSVVGK